MPLSYNHEQAEESSKTIFNLSRQLEAAAACCESLRSEEESLRKALTCQQEQHLMAIRRQCEEVRLDVCRPCQPA
jgi:hypothetical protein